MSRNKTHTRRRFSIVKSILFIIVILFFLFLLFEITLRIFNFHAYQIDFSVYSNVPGDITPNQDIVWRLPHIDHSFEISINEQGFRNPGMMSGDSYFRVLCLGDSSTMGYGVDDSETYPARLAELAALEYPDICDILNAGTIGYSIDDEYAYLQEKGFRLNPDVVALEIFFNDVIEKISRERVTQRDFRKKNLPYWGLKSALLRLDSYHFMRNMATHILIRLGKYFPENPFDKADLALNPEKYPEIWSVFDEQLRALIRAVRDQKIFLIVIISPDKYQLYGWGYPLYNLKGTRAFQDHIISLLEEEGVAYVDLLPVFEEKMRYNKALFITYGMFDEHQSDIGQLIKAEEVYKNIRELFRKHGLISLYEKFPESDIHITEGAGGAYQSRKWTSRDDRVGIALEGNVDLIFPSLQLGKEPNLILSTDLPWWTDDVKDKCAMTLTVNVSDRETTMPETIFVYRYDSPPAQSQKATSNIISLRRWKNTAVSMTFSLRWKPATAERAELAPPRLLLPAPMIVNGSSRDIPEF